MAGIIQLLPDSIANQIAAGEVVQRPSSVVKELMENAIDAGASHIKVNIKDAGKTLIQVIDNGCGMSPIDARLAFERHATSKIRKANDLYTIRTMGFRGEALASIAAVSNVTLKTRKHEEEIGTQIIINGSALVSRESTACPAGSNFNVKNLFFNIPARRKFLSSDATEFRHIIQEFQHMVLAQPDVAFQLFRNENQVYNLPKKSIKQRIINLFGKSFNKKLIAINTTTPLLKISGFIGTPDAAKKAYGKQFFFVNKRFIKHPYFHKAVLQSYAKLIPTDHIPVYFLNIDIDPTSIDVNIHPTKTVVKFEEQQIIYQIIKAAVKEALGKFSFVPSIDFEEDFSVQIPTLETKKEIIPPKIKINPTYNPFHNEKKSSSEKDILSNWETLYKETKPEEEKQLLPEEKQGNNTSIENDRKKIKLLQLKNQYLLVQVKSGLMMIDQRRAHIRVLYEKFLSSLQNVQSATQQLLFPETVKLTVEEFSVIETLMEDLKNLGFYVDVPSRYNIVIKGIPSGYTIDNLQTFFEDLIHRFIHIGDFKKSRNKKLALSMAQVAAINHGTPLSQEEMETLFNSLFACKVHIYTPNGKKITHLFEIKDFQKYFK